MKCIWHCCKKKLTGRQTKFCSNACSSKYYVTNRRRELKRLAVKHLGGKCSKCGYNKCLDALEFHHLRDKKFRVASGNTKSWEKLKKEVEKCTLVCANCHREEHAVPTAFL